MRFLEATHDLTQAIAERKKVCELVPDRYFSHYTLGVDLKESGALAESREVLLKASALMPEQADVRLELGIVYARMGEWEAARKELEARGAATGPDGADGGGRTHTLLRVPDFESSASANSATSASTKRNIQASN